MAYTIQPSTLGFLRQLRQHNHRAWFEQHRDEYLLARADVEQLVAGVIEKFSQIDSAIAGLEPKDCLFRIYRDTRFSKDKTPYKTHLAASFHRNGKKVHAPGYYLHLEPGGKSFIGGGIWHPFPEDLKKIRQEIDYNLEEFEQILHQPAFRRRFGQLTDEEALQRPPKGYAADHPGIAYLKMRNFVVGHEISDEEVLSPKLLNQIVSSFALMKPFIDFLSRALDD
ncbi:DUF2461 domain-containing protein [Thermoflavifilum thermophilum]|uniref:TIGR02453 family protein n=1 Tax=Thermoflavifilum thermophilum TaxID=1393122 RepID=A0A1I7NA32_9BACT|nr:DUF2461 domain-containing protein [Thermoflavifilum thermophilum]SFV31530.1 TIGR02453 family protein [Thermoflavifilum thermophilum]